MIAYKATMHKTPQHTWNPERHTLPPPLRFPRSPLPPPFRALFPRQTPPQSHLPVPPHHLPACPAVGAFLTFQDCMQGWTPGSLGLQRHVLPVSECAFECACACACERQAECCVGRDQGQRHGKLKQRDIDTPLIPIQVKVSVPNGVSLET